MQSVADKALIAVRPGTQGTNTGIEAAPLRLLQSAAGKNLKGEIDMHGLRGHGKLAAFLAAFCLMLFWAHTSYPQRNSPFEMARSEAEGITRFAQAFHDYDVDFQALKKKPRATVAEIAGVEKKANSVRIGISDYRQNLNAFISKLKGAGKWTSEFDSHFEEMAAKSGYSQALISEVKGAGGARATLEKGLAQIGDFSMEIEQDLKEIRGRGSKASWFHGNLIQEAQAITGTLTCSVYRITIITCTSICYSSQCCQTVRQYPTCPPCCL